MEFNEPLGQSKHRHRGDTVPATVALGKSAAQKAKYYRTQANSDAEQVCEKLDEVRALRSVFRKLYGMGIYCWLPYGWKSTDNLSATVVQTWTQVDQDTAMGRLNALGKAQALNVSHTKWFTERFGDTSTLSTEDDSSKQQIMTRSITQAALYLSASGCRKETNWQNFLNLVEKNMERFRSELDGVSPQMPAAVPAMAEPAGELFAESLVQEHINP
jgi:hypothetical protein